MIFRRQIIDCDHLTVFESTELLDVDLHSTDKDALLPVPVLTSLVGIVTVNTGAQT